MLKPCNNAYEQASSVNNVLTICFGMCCHLASKYARCVGSQQHQTVAQPIILSKQKTNNKYDKARAELETKDTKGNTALHKASSTGHLEACKLLVAANAEIDIRNFAGCSPADFAVRCNREIKEYFASLGCIAASATNSRSAPSHQNAAAKAQEKRPVKARHIKN